MYNIFVCKNADIGRERLDMRGLFDIHCHVIPEVDDGAPDFNEAIKMLKIEYKEGVRTIIATPHFRLGMFETDPERIIENFLRLKEEAEKEKCGIDLYLGCEFHANMDMIKYLRDGRARTMAGSRYVLTEFSGRDDKRYIRERLYSLISHGCRPIIAHIERYSCLRKDISFIEELVNMGAYVQVNAGSITGDMGFGIKHFCRKLLKEQLIHFVGTDAHDVKYRAPRINAAYSYIAKTMGDGYADMIFSKNPQRMIK